MTTSAANTLRLHVHVEVDEAGMYVAQVRELPGCVAQGVTQDEALDKLRAVIPVYLNVALDRMKPRHVGDTPASGSSHGGNKQDFVLALA